MSTLVNKTTEYTRKVMATAGVEENIRQCINDFIEHRTKEIIDIINKDDVDAFVAAGFWTSLMSDDLTRLTYMYAEVVTDIFQNALGIERKDIAKLAAQACSQDQKQILSNDFLNCALVFLCESAQEMAQERE